jgi:hypothetical protein
MPDVLKMFKMQKNTLLTSRSRKCCNTSIGLYQLSNGKAIVVIDTSRMPSGIFISLIASKTKPVAKYKKRNP